MITLFDNEINPFFGSETEKIRMNFTNNIRWLYIDLFDNGRVRNVKDFAFLCHLPQSTVESWLRRNVIPKPERRKMVEHTFNLAEGSLMNEIRPAIRNWSLEYYERNGAKPTLKTYIPSGDDLPATAEANSSYVRNAEKDIGRLCKELIKYEDILNENEVIREIVTTWEVLRLVQPSQTQF